MYSVAASRIKIYNPLIVKDVDMPLHGTYKDYNLDSCVQGACENNPGASTLYSRHTLYGSWQTFHSPHVSVSKRTSVREL